MRMMEEGEKKRGERREEFSFVFHLHCTKRNHHQGISGTYCLVLVGEHRYKLEMLREGESMTGRVDRGGVLQ